MSHLRAKVARWQHWILSLLLAATLCLILALAYRIETKQRLANEQTLTIQANAWMSVSRQTFSLLSAMVRQDYRTYTGLQESIGNEADLTALVYASNHSYESRIMDSLSRLRDELSLGHAMLGVLYQPAEGEGISQWFQQDYPYKDSVAALVKESQNQLNATKAKVDPKVRNPWEELPRDAKLSDLLNAEVAEPSSSENSKSSRDVPSETELQLIELVVNRYFILAIHLDDGSQVACVFDPTSEFASDDFQITATDAKGVSFHYNKHKGGRYSCQRSLYGLELVFSTAGKGESFLAIILPAAFMILILLLFQSRSAMLESTTHELTGLPNMRTFERHYHRTLQRPGTSFLFFLDLRNLKQLNSIFLEEQVDEVIKFFAKTLRATLDRNDAVIHRSGDEFFILLSLANTETLNPILERIRQAFADKSLRLKVYQNRDREGKTLSLHGRAVQVGSFVDTPISFRIGGMEIERGARALGRKQLLEEVNLLAEQAKHMEAENQPGMVWLVKHRQGEEDVILRSDPVIPHLVVQAPRKKA